MSPLLCVAKRVFKALDGTVLIFNFIVDSVLKSAWIQSKPEFLRYASLIKIYPMKTVVSVCLIFLITRSGFSQESPLFEALTPSKTGIHFKNILEETPTSNVLTYEYFYNGG